MNKRFGALSSSTNPEQLSATVSGLILSAGAIIIMIAGWLNIPLTDGQIGELASQAGIVVGALWTLYGVLRKVVVRFSQSD